jgi:hypothetical protein
VRPKTKTTTGNGARKRNEDESRAAAQAGYAAVVAASKKRIGPRKGPVAAPEATGVAMVTRVNLVRWLEGADLTDPDVVRKIVAMMRTAEDEGEHTKHKAAAILCAVRANADHLDTMGDSQFAQCARNLLMPAHADLALRLTDKACAALARALTAPRMAHRKGVPLDEDALNETVLGKHAKIARELSAVLGVPVSEETVKKSLVT